MSGVGGSNPLAPTNLFNNLGPFLRYTNPTQIMPKFNFIRIITSFFNKVVKMEVNAKDFNFRQKNDNIRKLFTSNKKKICSSFFKC